MRAEVKLAVWCVGVGVLVDLLMVYSPSNLRYSSRYFYTSVLMHVVVQTVSQTGGGQKSK